MENHSSGLGRERGRDRLGWRAGTEPDGPVGHSLLGVRGYRVVGAVNGTTLAFDPPVAGAPAGLDRGRVVDFEASAAFRVTAQDAAHPFFVSRQMSGCFVSGGSRPGVSPNAPLADINCLGDEDDVGLVPPVQWLSRYLFFTDPAYGTSNLVVVRSESGAAFSDVTVDCLGPLAGWQPVGSDGRFEFTSADLVRAGAGSGTCSNGPHVARSHSPFALVVWGLDSFASYSYPAGGDFRSINSVVVPPTPQ